MIDLNMLKRYMDFAKQNGLVQDYSSHDGFNASPTNINGEAASWAERMMGHQQSQAPDYFANIAQAPSLPAYKAPQRNAPASMPAMGGYAPSPMTDQVNNYLATLMKGRR